MKKRTKKAMQANNALSECVGKVRHLSFISASQAARRDRLEAYHCRWCGKFHVGRSGIPPGTRSPHKRLPYIVFARAPDGRIHLIGRAAKPDGGALVGILAKDGFEVTEVVPG